MVGANTRKLYLGSREDAPQGKNVRFDGSAMYVYVTEAEMRALATKVPDNAVNIPNPAAAPSGTRVVRGPRGGWYYVPEPGEPSPGESAPSQPGEPSPGEGAEGFTINPNDVAERLPLIGDERPPVDPEESLEMLSDSIADALESIKSQAVANDVLDGFRGILYLPPMATMLGGRGGSASRASRDVPDLGLEEGELIFRLNEVEARFESQFHNTYRHEMAHGVHMVYGYDRNHDAEADAGGVFKDDPTLSFDGDVEDFKLTKRDRAFGEEPPEVAEYADAINEAFERVYEAVEEGDPNWERFDVSRAYSATNAAEMWAGLHESLTWNTTDRKREAIAKVERHHPGLLDAYLGVFDPGEETLGLIAEYRERTDGAPAAEEAPA